MKGRKLVLVSLTILGTVLTVMALSGTALADPKWGWLKPTWDEETAFEIELGKKLYPLAVERGGSIAQAGKLQYSVSDIFEDVAREARRYRAMPYELTVVSSGEIDAWSLPGGDVFVTLGMIRVLKYADELAGIFAHELAHAVAGDNVRQVTSKKGQEILEKIATGELPATMETLGVYGAAVLGYGYATHLDKGADDLAKRLLKDSRYDPRGMNFALWRIKEADKRSRYLRTHPHPGLSPMVPQAPAAVTPVAPPVVVVPVPAPVPGPTPKVGESGDDEQSKERERERERHQQQAPRGPYHGPSFALWGFGGATSLVIPPQTKTATIGLFPGGTLPFEITQPGVKNPGLIGLGGDLRWPNRLEIGFRFGFAPGVKLFKDSSGDSVTSFEGSVGRVLVKGDMLSLSLGAFGSYMSASGTAGILPREPGIIAIADPSDPNNYFTFDEGTPVKGRASGFGGGVYLNIGGSIGDGGGLGWFVDGRYQFLRGGRYAYTAKDQSGTDVAIKMEGAELEPFTATGVVLTGGLAYRF